MADSSPIYCLMELLSLRMGAFVSQQSTIVTTSVKFLVAVKVSVNSNCYSYVVPGTTRKLSVQQNKEFCRVRKCQEAIRKDEVINYD
jgi:hypothetical protein